MDDQITALAEIDPTDVLLTDDKHFSLGDSQEYLNRIVQGAKDIVEHPGFWNELPRPTQTSLHNEAETILRVVRAVRDNRDNPQWLSTQIDGHVESLTNLYNTVYPWFVTAIREYKNSQDTQKQEVASLLKELKGVEKSAKESSKLATEASSTISTVELSRFFDEVANGSKSAVAKEKKEHKHTWKYRVPSYSADARRWFIGVLLSIAATGLTAYFAFRGVLEESLTLEEVIARGLILTAPAYAIKFCARHYAVNKQLQVTNTHRAVVMKTLLAFLQREEITPEVRESIITEAAKQAFKGTDTNHQSEADSVIEIPVPWKKA